MVRLGRSAPYVPGSAQNTRLFRVQTLIQYGGGSMKRKIAVGLVAVLSTITGASPLARGLSPERLTFAPNARANLTLNPYLPGSATADVNFRILNQSGMPAH